ncbi:hypothetical protein EBS02_11015 [bacterium]|nr:hypothetical protein [bacterium]
MAINFLNIQIFKHKKSHPLAKKTKIILSNHRSFTDFFLDSYLIGHASHLSRLFVAFALPAAGLYGWLSGRVLFFRRGSTPHRILGQRITNHFKSRPVPMIFYPEAHRNIKLTPLPLKPGGIKMCFERRWPIQLSIAKGKEDVLYEKKWAMRFNVPCYWLLTEVIDPADYTTQEEFYEAINRYWLEAWNIAYAAPHEDFVVHKQKNLAPRFAFSYRWLVSWGVLLVLGLSYYKFNT